VPKHNFINFKLDADMEELLERQVFEEYKSKVLRGIVDEVEVVSVCLSRNKMTPFGERIPFQSTISIVSAKII
jgi:hypothetical protein